MKTDWSLINKNRVRSGYFASKDEDGFNGAFCFLIGRYPVKVIASDGMDWQHVSVSIQGSKNSPPWSVMCEVVKIFWGDDEWVMQLHPPASANISNHPGCLHLWRPLKAQIPTPPPNTVGIKELGEIKDRNEAILLNTLAQQGIIG